MEILLTGKRGKLYQSVATALSDRRGSAVLVLPVSSRLFAVARTHSLQSVLFTVQREQEIEPLRWLLQQNRSLPVVAVLSRKDRELREQLLREGVHQVVVIPGLTASQIRRKLGRFLRQLPPKTSAADPPSRQVQASLHSIRSVLTAILGNAEIALKNSSRAAPHRKQLQEIVRGVSEIEKTLRLLERTWKPRATPPRQRR